MVVVSVGFGGGVRGVPHSGHLGSDVGSVMREYPHLGQMSWPSWRSSW